MAEKIERADIYGTGRHIGIPSDEELNQVKRLLAKHVKAGDHVLVLGATAELRSAALELGCKVLAVDISLDMIYKREKIVTIRDANNDVVARGNWLKPWFLKKNFFRAIIGDASFNNINYKQILRLFGIVKKVAGDDGVMIIRHGSFFDQALPSELCKMYNEGKIELRELGMSGYFNKFLKRRYQDRLVDVEESMEAVAMEMESAGIRKEDCNFVRTHKWRGNHCIMDQDEWHSLLMKHFGNYHAYASNKKLYSRAVPIYLVKIK